MIVSDHQYEFLKDLAKLIQFIESDGQKVTATWLKRDRELQRKMVENGLSKTMDSKHLDSLAIDLNFFINRKYTTKKEDIEKYGKYWESLNSLNRWGGYFKGFGKDGDSGHFERNI